MPRSATVPFVMRALFSALLAFAPFAAGAADASAVEQGKTIAFNRSLGNCLACHDIKGGDSPGNIGPPLVNMQARYPDKEDVTVLLEPDIEYNDMINVMDSVKVKMVRVAGQREPQPVPLFPEVSIGDTPS